MTHSPRERTPERLGERLVERCKEAGFALAGITPVRPSDEGDRLDAWLDASEHGSMSYMREHAALRKDAALLLEGARSVIMVADQYASRGHEDGAHGAPFGRIAKYARGRDYHTVIKKRLHALCDALQEQHPDARFRAFVDTAPIMEREQALRAGLGWIGKHTLLIHKRRGSYLLLGGILTTLELEPPRTQRVEPDHCGSCTRCIDACPTDAITPYTVDARKCISYLTIERRERIDPALHKGMGDWVFGCDICQDVCPHNSARRRLPTGRVHHAYEARREGFDLLAVLGWRDEDRREAFTTSAMKRATLPMMRRNAVIALGNAYTQDRRPEWLDAIRDALEDEHDLVRTTARDVMERLSP